MNKKILISLISLIFVLSFFFGATSDIVKTADKYYNNDEKKENYNVLKNAYDAGNKDFEILWRLARATKNYPDDNDSDDIKLEKYEEALVYADEANAKKPANDIAHFWAGAIIGSIGEVKGPLNAIMQMGTMKNEILAALDYNSNYHNAYMLYGNLYFKGYAVTNPFKSSTNKNIGISLLYKALDLYKKYPGNTDLGTRFYSDLIVFLIKRDLSLKKAKDVWASFRKEYQKKSGIEKELFFYGSLSAPTRSDFDEALYLYSMLEKMPEHHYWDTEKKNIAKDAIDSMK